MVRIDFGNGYMMEMGYYPERVKPVILLLLDGKPVAHAAVHDQAALGQFVKWADRTFTPGYDWESDGCKRDGAR